MANQLLTFCPTGIHARAIPGNRKNITSSSSASWWTLLFGVPSEAGYISSDIKTEAKKKRPAGESETGLVQESKTSAGRLTEDKAKQLRVMTNKTSSFHDLMYHSAIASRLASDFNDAL